MCVLGCWGRRGGGGGIQIEESQIKPRRVGATLSFEWQTNLEFISWPGHKIFYTTPVNKEALDRSLSRIDGRYRSSPDSYMLSVRSALALLSLI